MNNLKKITELEKQKEKLSQTDRDLDKQIFQVVKDIIKNTSADSDKKSLFRKNGELYKLKGEISNKILNIDIEIFNIAKNVLEKSI